MNATTAKVIEENISVHFDNAKQECATAHQSGNVNGFANVNRMNAFSIASRPAATRPKIAKIKQVLPHLSLDPNNLPTNNNIVKIKTP